MGCMKLFALLLLHRLAVTDARTLDQITMACSLNPSLPYCPGSTSSDQGNIIIRSEVRHHPRRASPPNPFEDKAIEPDSSNRDEENDRERVGGESSDSDEATRTPVIQELPPPPPLPPRPASSPRPQQLPYFRRASTPPPAPLNPLFTLFPALQKDRNPYRYCPANQYTFQRTCLPGKKLRYDLQVFCQEFADTCGVPNINLFKSRVGREDADEGRPKGFGQKQQSGNFGTGNSFSFGLGVLPGFEIVGSRGADIGDGKLPFFDQIGGMMINTGTDIGAMGRRTGRGPARSLASLSRGFPTFGLQGADNMNDGDKKMVEETAKNVGLGNLNNLVKLIKGDKKGGQRNRNFYEPGYGALDKKNPLAFGKVDTDEFNIPGGLGDIEITNGSGYGFGK